MLKAKFPLYALRQFDEITTEGVYVLVHTHFNTYILDIPSLEGNYANRRLKMTSMELPYKVYPIKEQFNMLSQLANSKRRVFIDSEGKIHKYKPQKFYKVQYVKVLCASKTWNGYYLITTKLPVNFVTDIVPKYIGYIQIGAAFYLYDYSNEPKQPTRKKV